MAETKAKWASIPIYKDGLRSLPTKPGYVHTSVAVGIEGTQGKFGELFFKESSLKSTKNPKVAMLSLLADREYNVGFTNPETKQWDYERMTGQQIHDGNQSYLDAKKAEKQSFTQSFEGKYQAGLKAAEADEKAGKTDFSNGESTYTKDELNEHLENVYEFFDIDTMDLDQDILDAHDEGYDAVRGVVEYELSQYFGTMTDREQNKLMEMAKLMSRGSEPAPDGKIGEVLKLAGGLEDRGWDVEWERTSESVKSASQKASERPLPDVPQASGEAQADTQFGA